VDVLFDVSPHVFYPRPAVTSALVHVTMRAASRAAVDDEAFFRAMVRSVFGKRRKTSEIPSGISSKMNRRADLRIRSAAVRKSCPSKNLRS